MTVFPEKEHDKSGVIDNVASSTTDIDWERTWK